MLFCALIEFLDLTSTGGDLAYRTSLSLQMIISYTPEVPLYTKLDANVVRARESEPTEKFVVFPVKQHLYGEGRVSIVPHIQYFPKAAIKGVVFFSKVTLL